MAGFSPGHFVCYPTFFTLTAMLKGDLLPQLRLLSCNFGLFINTFRGTFPRLPRCLIGNAMPRGK
jgi:hypothetical protein